MAMFDSVKFRVICCDPPWDFPPNGWIGGHKTKTGRQRPTVDPNGWFGKGRVLSEAQLCSASISIPKMDNSCLFLWCTASNVPMAVRVMEAWGFRYKTSFVWVKTHPNGNIYFLPGYWSYVAHELLLFGVSGKFRRDGPVNGSARMHRSVFTEPFPRGHGYKPDAIYEAIQSAYAGPYLELFATKRRPGWFAYGDSVEGGSDISIPEWDGLK